MLWPTVIGCPLASDFELSSHAVFDSPYIFSISINNQNQKKNMASVPFDFLIQSLETKHYLQLVFSSGQLRAIDGIVVAREQCIRCNSRYSDLGKELPYAPVFTLAPMRGGDAPRLTDMTVMQKVRLSLLLYSDAVIVSFDAFKAVGQIRVTDSFDIALSENGGMAGFIFRNHLAEYIAEKIESNV
jgi:hypothetical protein